MSFRQNLRTEHAGAKNGGGHWGRREEAKEISRVARRKQGQKIVRQELETNEPTSL